MLFSLNFFPLNDYQRCQKNDSQYADNVLLGSQLHVVRSLFSSTRIARSSIDERFNLTGFVLVAFSMGHHGFPHGQSNQGQGCQDSDINTDVVNSGQPSQARVDPWPDEHGKHDQAAAQDGECQGKEFQPAERNVKKPFRFDYLRGNLASARGPIVAGNTVAKTLRMVISARPIINSDMT